MNYLPQRFKTSCFIILCTVSLLFYAATAYAQTKWFKAGSNRDKYSMGVDSSFKHDNKEVMAIKSMEQGITGFGTFMSNLTPEKYIGKRIRMSGFVKSKEVTTIAGLWLRVDQNGSDQALAFDNMYDRPITGTTGWKKYEIVLVVPNNASNIAFGALLSGTGQVWFDKLDFEIVDGSVKTTGQNQEN
jgi:hypothetical protein